MTKLTAESSIADIAARFNELNGTTTEVKTLAKRGKAKLLAQIEALEAKLPPASEPEPSGPIGSLAKQLLQQPVSEPATPAEKPKRAKKDPAAAKKEKGPVIRVEAEKLLLEVVKMGEDKRPWGHSYEYILSTLLAQFPGAKTTVACLRWYAVHMRERGEKVPNRPRANPKAE